MLLSAVQRICAKVSSSLKICIFVKIAASLYPAYAEQVLMASSYMSKYLSIRTLQLCRSLTYW
jgi:hypothetical protein